jgi:hypothetical protein
MNFNWGTGILIFIIIFFIAIFGFVYFSSTQLVNLVEEDYYPKELAYDEQIEKMRNYSKSGYKIHIGKKPNSINIRYEGITVSDGIKGIVHLYRPSDYRKDIKIPVIVNDTGYQFIPRKDLLPGKYIIKIDWTVGKMPYYFEETFIND